MHALPDVSRLASFPAESWEALGQRFRQIGLTSRAYAPFVRLAAFASNPRHAALAKWNLRRIQQPSAYAMRMLSFFDPVTPGEAQEVLGDEIELEPLVDIGLLVASEEGVVSPFLLRLIADVFVFGDDLGAGGEAVMGPGPSTKALAGFARPRDRAGRALDVGCGAGTVALALAQKCDRVVATDISERAVTLARVNAALGGFTNVECRVGDLFEAVAGESFDVIASQPPFVPREDDAGNTTFLHGGPRGDEISLRLFHGLRAVMAPRSMAFLLAEWPVIEGDRPIDERIAAALGAPADLGMLHVRSPSSDVDEHCARYATIEHPHGDAAYERAAMRRREHFEKMRIRELVPMVSVIRRDEDQPAWISVVEVKRDVMSRARVEAMVAARDLLTRGRDALRAARLRLGEDVTAPKDSVIAQVHASGGAAGLPEEALDAVEEALLGGLLEVVAT